MPSLCEDDAMPLPCGVVPVANQVRRKRLRHHVSAAESLVNKLLEDEGEPVEPRTTELLNALKDTSASTVVIQTHYGDHVLPVIEWWESSDGTFHISVQPE
jgi:hypothetical protein